MTRRSLLRRAFLVLGIAPMGLIGCAFRRVASAKAGPLSPAEMEDLVAFGEVVVEGRTLAPPERRYLVEHIEERTTGSVLYLGMYRGVVSTLDRLAGQPFARLEIRERIEFIARHRLAGSKGAPEEDLGPLAEETRALRTRAVPDLIRGYYASPAGWAIAGYDDAFPGRCGDLTRYTRPAS